MRIAHNRVVRTLVTLVVSGCGAGSGLVGIATGNGGDTTNQVPPVLAFFVQPNSANVGQVISPPVEVAARDSLGGIDTLFTGNVTIALASNSTGATLSGTRTVRARDGIARFANLSIDRPGTYTLQASTPGAAAVTSTPFSITSIITP